MRLSSMHFTLFSTLATFSIATGLASQYLENQIAVFSSLPAAELIDSLSPTYRQNILTKGQSPVPKPEILTFDNVTHILVWKFTKEQREYLKQHEGFIGIESDNAVHIAPFTGKQNGTDVEEQGSDASSLDGASNPLNKAFLNNTRMVTQSNVPNWGLARISQQYLPLQNNFQYPESAGEGIDVYVIDTGINVQHQDFGGRAVWGITTVDNSSNIDDNGHGTFVAGIVGGSLFGVAKKVRMIAVKALDENGSGSVSDILYGLQYVIKNSKKSGNSNRSIVNLSLGTQKSVALDQAVTALVNAGIIMIAAAGNGDENGVGQNACDFSPASARTALTVGSTDRTDTIAPFSNFGPCVNLFAPGVRIRSTWVGSNTATYISSGTSFSTPFVAGVVATYIAERFKQKLAILQPADIIRDITSMATGGVIHGLDSSSPDLLLYNGLDGESFNTQKNSTAHGRITVSKWMIVGLVLSWLNILAEADETIRFQEELELFDFIGDAIDMALRRLLAKVHLPKESQQIDRALEAFAKHYHQCNPDLAESYDSAYAMAFSILLLHTDAHNKNVKRKMNRDTFIMRTRLIEGGENIPAEILDVIYDNIVNVEFQYANAMEPAQERQSSKGTDTRGQTSWLNKLGIQDGSNSQIPGNGDLEAFLEKILPAENPYDFKANFIDIDALRRAFSRAPTFMLAGVKTKQSSSSIDNSKPVTDTSSIYSKVASVYGKDNGYMVRVAQAGILDRKYEQMQGGKRANVRGWRPFGMILSGSQLIFFADITAFLDWFDIPKNEAYIPEIQSVSSPSTPTDSVSVAASLTADQFTPPERTPSPMLRSSTSFASLSPTISSTSSSLPMSYLRPVQIISLTDAVCFCDRQYSKYPNAFRLHTSDGQQFVFRAETEQEMHDWMGKLNYAASIKSSGMRLGSSHSHRSRNSQLRQDEILRRQEQAEAKAIELSAGIENLNQRIEQDLCLRRNLMVLVPLHKASREKIIQYAELVGSRLQAYRLRITKLECYRTILEKEVRSIRENEMIRKMVGISLQRTPSTDTEPYDLRNRMRRSFSAAPGYQRQPYDGTSGPKVPARVSSLVGIPKGFFIEGIEQDKPQEDGTSERQSHDSDRLSFGSTEERDNERIRLVITEPVKLPAAKNESTEHRQRSYSNDEVLASKNKGMWDWTNKLRAGLGGSNEDKPIPVPAVQALKQTKLMRRRSRSHPTIPAGREQDKPLLQTKAVESRQRSNSELSSVGDDEELCVDGPSTWE